MKIYWKYVDKIDPNDVLIYERDTKKHTEREVYHSYGPSVNEEFEVLCRNLKDERKRCYIRTITRISRENAFLEMI